MRAKRSPDMAAADILVILRPGDEPKARLDLAARIARRTGARVQGVCLEQESPPAISDCWAVGPTAVCDVLERRKAEETAEIAPLRAEFLTAIQAAGIAGELAVAAPWETTEVCVARAASSRLAVLGQPDEDDWEQRRLVETMAVQGHAPCLIMQDEARSAPTFRAVVVGWDGGVRVRRALEAATPLLEPGARVELFTVGALGARAEDDTTAVIACLRSLGLDAQRERSTTTLSSAGYALLRRCDVVRADLLVMGAFSEPPTVEAVIDGATRTALLRAQIPLLLAH